MATNSIDLLSVIPGIQVSATDILQAELLLCQTLTAQDPTLDVRTGTAIRDLAIRPNATLLATINKALTYFWSQNAIQNADDKTPAVFVDKILENFFMTRFAGAKTVINARLYFAKQTSVTLTTDIFFSPNNVIKFFPTVSGTYGANQLTFDPSVNQYYLSVDLTAENTGTAYNISSGSLIYFSNFNPFFLHAEINYLKALATDSETNTQFIARARNAISTRNLINDPSIKNNIAQNFPIVSAVTTVGMGDPAMIRDKVQVTPPVVGYPVWIHLGGCTDIYSRVPIVSSILQFTTDSAGQVPLTGSIFKTRISAIPGGPNTDVITVGTPYRVINSYSISVNPTAVTRSGNVAIVTSRSHGLSIGERFKLSGLNQQEYNGIFQVTSIIDKDTFTYAIQGTPVTPATGTPVLTIVDRQNDVGFSTRQSIVLDFSDTIKNITAASWGSNTVTITSAGHGYITGDIITVSGLSVSAFNGIFTITVTSPDQFTYASSTNPGGPVVSTGATAQKKHANQSVSIELFYHQDIDGIQTYLSDRANKVTAADQLARGFNLTLLDVSIVGYGATAPSQATASKIVTTYLESLAPGQTFIMADLLSALSAAGITTIQTPLSITYAKYWRDIFDPTYGIIVDALNPRDPTNVFMLNSVSTSVATL